MAKKGYKYPPGRNAWNKGLSSWNKGKTKEEFPQLSNSGRKKGCVSPNKGKYFTKEHKNNLSLAHIGISVGEKSALWKGGINPLVDRIRHSFKYRQWRCDVFTRDDFTCQNCGRRGCYLNAHHTLLAFADIIELNDIKTYEQAMDCEELWNINNGETLCEKCHDETKNGRPK